MIDLWAFLRKCKFGIYKMVMSPDPGPRSIICNNCLGGMVSHDFALQFCSPFVNLMIPANHYIEILKNLKDIRNWEFQDITPEGNDYPIGLLNSLWEVHFIHYKTYDEAVEKWFLRLARMRTDELYLILVETASCSINELFEFDKLPFKHKIAVTHKPYQSVRCAKYISGYDGKNLNGELFWRSNKWRGRLYDAIDWKRFLNL